MMERENYCHPCSDCGGGGASVSSENCRYNFASRVTTLTSHKRTNMLALLLPCALLLLSCFPGSSTATALLEEAHAPTTQLPGNCSQVKCPPVESCPGDSYRLPSLVMPSESYRHMAGRKNVTSTGETSMMSEQQKNCCPAPSPQKCQCIPDLLCTPKECPPGLKAHVSKNATGKPGGCCPKFECLPATEKHSPHQHHNYHDPPQKLHSAALQYSSARDFDSNLPFDLSSLEDDSYESDTSEDALVSDEFSTEDNALPPLNDESSAEKGRCFHNGKVYKSGESWSVQSECSECFCEKGLVSCKPISCNVPAECRLARAQPRSCCPVCDGCVSARGKAYNMSETWQEDPCTNCTCQNGRIQCHTSSCKRQHSCENPKYFPGECCPRCENEAPDIGSPPHTFDKDSCPFHECHRDISCPNGFRLDKSGCPTCECQKCHSLLGCKLSCARGFKVDHFGCTVCECRGESDAGDQSSSLGDHDNGGGHHPLENDNDRKADSNTNDNLYGYDNSNEVSSSSGDVLILFCTVDSDGVRRVEGEEWSDHCRRCVCRNGREMCSLITCQPPKCEHPIFYPGDCCPRCPVEESSSSFNPVNVSICISSDGKERLDGEIWSLSSCLTCTCHQGQVLCAGPECLPTPCHSPKLVDCCLQCPDNTTSSHHRNNNDGQQQHNELDKVAGASSSLNCLSDDSVKSYLDGEMWKVGACQSCSCEAGQIKCFSAGKCPSVECAHPILAKNQCCPICLDTVVHKSAIQKHHGVEGANFELHHFHGSNVGNNHTTTTASRVPGGGLEPHCAVIIACLLVVTILLSLYIVRQVCFHRRGSRRLIKKVPVSFHSASSSCTHSLSVTPDCCYKCDYTKYCDGDGCVILSGSGGGGSGNLSSSNITRGGSSGGCTPCTSRGGRVGGISRSGSTNGSNGNLSSEQKPLFHEQHHHQQQYSSPTAPPPL